jgi:hypothetical protein
MSFTKTTEQFSNYNHLEKAIKILNKYKNVRNALKNYQNEKQ